MNNLIKTILFIPLYPFYYAKYCLLKKKFPKVEATLYTLEKIRDERKSIARYGDGELNIITGHSIGFQKNNTQLAEKLQLLLKETNNDCLICIPDVFHGISRFKFDAKSFWLYTIIKKWKYWRHLFKREGYYDSLCTRYYMDLKDKTFSETTLKSWRSIWNNRDIVIIEGENTKMGIGNDLFDEVNSLKRIICPSINAFNYYNEIYQEAIKLDKSCLILIALGPTATILAYELAKVGYQALDTGHLDLEYCWMKEGAKKKRPVAGRFVNEISNNDIETIRDAEYETQIIKKIGKC